MAIISELLNKIKNAVYGIEVRDAIHDSIKQCYDDVTNSKTLADESIQRANVATRNAENKASLAEAATNNANTAANSANAAAKKATDEAEKVETVINQANANNQEFAGLKENINVVIANANAAKDAANKSSEAATNATSLVNTAIERANTSADNANEKASMANIAASNANSKAGIADTATKNANTAADRANKAASNADDKANAANTASSTANIKISEMNSALSLVESATQSANSAASEASSAMVSATNAAANAEAKANLANEAASNANTAASECNTTVTNAKIAIGNAEREATRASKASEEIENLKVTSENVAANVPASVEFSIGQNGYREIHFKLRQGNDGAPYMIKGKAFATLESLRTGISNPAIGDLYNVGEAAPYNVYRWTGNSWENQGPIGTSLSDISTDEVNKISNGETITSSVKKYLELNGLKQFRDNENAKIEKKVDKVSGKGLSTNDFTDAHKSEITRLAGLGVDLQNNKVDKITGKNLSTNDFTTEYKNQVDTNKSDITTLKSGKVDKVVGKSLSSNDFTNVYKSQVDTNKSDVASIKTDVSNLKSGKVDKADGKELSSNDFTTEYKTQIDTNKDEITLLKSEKAAKDHNHDTVYIKKEGAVLDTTDNTIENFDNGTNDRVVSKLVLNSKLESKVDKVVGKELSSNDFTDAYKSQIDTNKGNITNIQNRLENMPSTLGRIWTIDIRTIMWNEKDDRCVVYWNSATDPIDENVILLADLKCDLTNIDQANELIEEYSKLFGIETIRDSQGCQIAIYAVSAPSKDITIQCIEIGSTK